MRNVLTAFFLAASACLAQAGVLVEFTDGTKLTVESHWNDGDQVHLVRGGVDMIVAKSRIKSIDEAAGDPEVYRGAGNGEAPPKVQGDVPNGAVGAEAAVEKTVAPDPALGELSADDLEALHKDEGTRLLELQDKRFNALYGGGTNPDQQKEAEDAFYKQNRRTAEVFGALQKAKQAESGDVPSVPRVEQPQ
jgi:hypothetical protein